MKPPSLGRLVTTQAGLKRDPGCRLCPLHETAEHVCLLGSGSRQAIAMIIGEAPGASEDATGSPFVGRSGKLLDEVMSEVGLDRDDFYVTNAVHCRPPNNRTPSKSEIRKCSGWLKYEINSVAPDIVLLMGATPLLAVLGLTGIKKLRGQPIQRGGITYLPTWHPAYVIRDERARPQLRSDLSKLKALISGGGVVKVPGLNHRIVENEEDVVDMLRHLQSADGIVYDCETTGLSPHHGRVVSLNIGDRRKQWCLPINGEAWSSPWSSRDIRRIIRQIDEVIRDKPKCNQNGKFDALWMKVHHGVYWTVDFDTMLAHHILDENSHHGLDVIAAERYNALDWDVPLSDKQGKTGTLVNHARYGCLDILYTSMLWEDLDEDLSQQPSLHRLFHKLVMPAAKMFVDVELHGITINESHFDTVEKRLNKTMAEIQRQLDGIVPGVNWGSPQQVAAVLFGKLGLEPLDMTKGSDKNPPKPSTSESVLKRLSEHHEVPKLLIKFREAKQQLSFFIEGWKPWLVDDGDRRVLHPSFKIHGTVTGRLSCADPNLQQVPRDPEIRQLITAKTGWILLEADLSQIELRLLAELSGDPEMLRCFQTGIDIHWLTAMREIFRGGGYHDEVVATAIAITRRNRVDYEDCYEILLKAGPDECIDKGPKKSDEFPGWKEVRKRAKAINFGYAYGMWWKKFIEYARDNYDVTVDAAQAQASRVSYFDLYSKLTGFHSKQRGFAHRHGYVKSLIGRKRRLPRARDASDTPERQAAERQAINSPIQGLASDLNIMAALELRKRHSPEYMQIVATVHDALLIEVRRDKIKLVTEDVLKIMQQPPLLAEFDVTLRVPIEADAKIGPWGIGVSPRKFFND